MTNALLERKSSVISANTNSNTFDCKNATTGFFAVNVTAISGTPVLNIKIQTQISNAVWIDIQNFPAINSASQSIKQIVDLRGISHFRIRYEITGTTSLTVTFMFGLQ